jgi:hypothetical protein
LGVQILHRTRWSRNGLKKSGRRVVLVSKIEIAFKICLTLLGDRVPWPGRICDFNQTGVFQLWKASFDCRVRDVVAFEIQIDFQPPLVQGSPGFSEILQDNVVPPSHPWSAVTSGHIRKPESSRIICRDLSLCEQISSILDQYTGQVLYPLTKKLVTGTDATLLGGGVTEKIAVCDAAWIQHGRRVGPREGCRPMSTQTRREQKSPARSDASPADHLRASAEQLSSTKARAVRALVSIHQLHLTEFQS